MYKKQLRFQKIICLLAIIAAAAMFVYALGMITDIHDSLRSTMRNPNDHYDTKVPGSVIYYDMQEFNSQFVNMSLVLILISCLLFLTNTQVRRKYYIGNYVAIGVYSIAAIALVVWSHVQIEAFKVQYLTTVDFAALEEYAEMWKTFYTDSTFLLDLHYVVGSLALLSAVLLVVNMIWKIRLMQAEKALIEEGKEAAV
jgi:hypothetical protein